MAPCADTSAVEVCEVALLADDGCLPAPAQGRVRIVRRSSRLYLIGSRTPVPDVTLPLILALLGVPIGAWLAIPVLIRQGNEFGYYLGWTFFASMGITELAHFVLPLVTTEPYGYFPGMASVVVLAPFAWWGMWRLARPVV